MAGIYQHSITACYMQYQGGRKICLQGLDSAPRIYLHLFIILFTSTLNKKTADTSNTLVTIYQISRCHTTADRNINLLNPTGYVTHHQFCIHQLFIVPTMFLCILYLLENKQRLVPLTPQIGWFL